MLPKLDLFHILIFSFMFFSFFSTLNMSDPSMWMLHHFEIRREISGWEVHILSNLKGKLCLIEMGSKVREIVE
jgi:hypothetical protein